MKIFNLYNTLLASTFLAMGFITGSFAQSQPQIQISSVRAPTNVKVDGELKEWGDKNLSAYNKANRIYYVVANDDDNLYLIIRGSGAMPAFKLLANGVTFTVSHSLEKPRRDKDPQNVSVIYPTAQLNGPLVSAMMVPVFKAERLSRDTVKNKKEIDSLTIVTNTRVAKTAKDIKVTGIKEIKDSILSVYNDMGIKAVMHFSKGEPVIEMAIPLKYLYMAVSNSVRFSYNIKLSVPHTNGDFNIMDLQKGGVSSGGPETDDLLYRFTETGLWGEYTLVKKN